MMNALRSAHVTKRRLPCSLAALLLCAPNLAHVREDVATRWTPGTLSTDQYEATPAFTPDGREVFFMLSDPKFARYWLRWSRCVNGAWSTPEPPPFAAPASIMEGDPFMTADGKRLYFISTRYDPKLDEFDIWYVDRAPDGRWLEPQRLPEPVNSPGSELLPRATAAGRIYFGSNRPGGVGGRDIYVAEQGRDGRWTAHNLGPPINTAANEYEAEISQDERTLILVANRGERSHLYRFEKRDGRWFERGQIAARADVFQVGPLLSPKADRLLFAQADGEQSGEMFLIDLTADPDERWPPVCRAAAATKR
jgi:WD40-like Beta Propeller Repeat